MNEARKIAAALGMRPASEVAAPPPQAMRSATGRAQPIRWTRARRDIWNFLRPVSISLVASDGPYTVTMRDHAGNVISQLGHNRLVWPARIVKGTTRHDAATTTWNRAPGVPMGTQARLWCLRGQDRDRLALALVDRLALRAERDGGLADLPAEFYDLGPEADLAFLEMEFHGEAQSLGIRTWDDWGLVRWFDSIDQRVRALIAERPHVRMTERVVSKIALADLEG